MKLSIVDTHAHLDMSQFNKDRVEVIARAVDSGVSTIVSVGSNFESSRKAIELAEKHSQVFAAVGFHPHDVAGVSEVNIAALAEIANNPRVVAIGEVGLDFYRNYSPREAQLSVLKWQLELAINLNLPVIIHCRRAEKEMLPLLNDWVSTDESPKGEPRGVVHCFSGDMDIAQRYLDMGFFIAFGAYIGYPTSIHMHDVVRYIPQDRLLVETDCPFLPPQSHRGKRNEPAYLPNTVAQLAEIRKVSLEAVAKETTQNARHLFCRNRSN
ncbi:TatD family hydrolase [Chloroflexota bacterium]